MQNKTQIAVLFIVIVLVGCSSAPKLMPAPNIYLGSEGYPESAVPEHLKGSRVDLMYITDRAPETSADGDLIYGTTRSASVGFGSAIVEIGKDLSWQELVELSQTASRKTSPPVQVVSRTELDRFPPTPHGFLVVDGRVKEDPVVQAEFDKVVAGFREEINRRMIETGKNEVHIFIHGFHNTFDYAAVSLAEYWHFIGRRGVPVLYSWPAASKGMFGYFKDREAGEFTIYHLKKMIRLMSSFPEVQHINILAHSRGTDVALTALRELIIEARGGGHNPRELYKVDNLILAAPDLDFDVVRQRFMAEKIGPAFGQITAYTSETDKALGLSQTLMSGTRFGRVQESDFGEREKAIFSVVKNVAIINVNNAKGFSGHGYYLNNPATSSDIIRVINTRTLPGDPQRPLTHKMLNFWDMPENYPNE